MIRNMNNKDKIGVILFTLFLGCSYLCRMNLNLTGYRALVCGSTQGIGKATALQLASMGASITLLARNEDKLKLVLNELNETSAGSSHAYLVADFSHPEQLMEIVSKYAASTDVHILINNTGGPAAGPANTAAIEDFRIAFNQHLICNQLLVQACLPAMKKKGYGRIINVISTSVKQPIKGLGVSNTIRGAVASWSKTLAGELAPFGITVNNLLPGATETERLQNIITNKAQKSGMGMDEVEKEMLAEIPAQRFASAHEIADAIAFLASPSAGYINGINLPVDGGRTACL
jgi:3-oxoacyl-[acyl-carrier protein] reductase